MAKKEGNMKKDRWTRAYLKWWSDYLRRHPGTEFEASARGINAAVQLGFVSGWLLGRRAVLRELLGEEDGE